MYVNKQLGTIVLLLTLAWAISISALAGDSQYFDSPPSVEELEKALLGGVGQQAKVKTRSLANIRPVESAQQLPVSSQTAAQMSNTQSVAASTTTTLFSAAESLATQSTQDAGGGAAMPIQFSVNSARILPNSALLLHSVAEVLMRNSGLRLIIEGHTDVSGSYQRNMALSEERAKAVRDYLVTKYGIDPKRLYPVGMGPSKPMKGLDPTDPKNRRVEFKVIGLS